MTTPLCILNMSDPERPLVLDPSIPPATTTIQSPSAIPTSPPGALVLYILGHGIQHGMVEVNNGAVKVWDEDALFQEILTRRKGLPTLLVWDTCFAESVLKINSPNVVAPPTITPGDENSWPTNFVHVFACLAYERTWHEGADPGQGSRTFFSTEFAKAVRDLQKETKGTYTWDALEKRLRAQYESLQKPRIVPRGAGLRPSDFDLDDLFADTTKQAKGAKRNIAA